MTDQPTSKLETVNTLQLRAGDIVRSHGMRLLCGEMKVTTHPGGNTRATRAQILNLDEVHAEGVVPRSWIADGCWTIQGNELAKWGREYGYGWCSNPEHGVCDHQLDADCVDPKTDADIEAEASQPAVAFSPEAAYVAEHRPY